jgi:hypothetical protein
MRTLEEVIFISAAVVIGFAMLGFLVDWNYGEYYRGVQRMIAKEKKTAEYEKVSRPDFAKKIIAVWKDCGLGELNKKYTIFLEGNSTFTRTELVSDLQKINGCEILQARDLNCGKRNDIVMTQTLNLPTIISLECLNNQIVVKG